MGFAGTRSGGTVALLATAWLWAGSARADEKPAPGNPTATLDEDGFTLKAADDSAKFELGGRLHTDFGSGGSRAVTDEFPDAARVRRLWIEPKLTIDKDLIFNLQYDPTSESTPINNLLLSYKGFGAFTLTGGNFKEPFSFEQLMSNNDILFMERSLADTFTPSRNTGFAIGTHGDNWTVSGGVFGGNVNASVERGGLAGTVRATYAPILTETEVLHLGIAGSYRSLDRTGPDLSFGTTPESFLFQTSLVDTDTIDRARAIGRLGFEFAWASGPFRIQAEYIATQVERTATRDVAFQGGYVQAAWVINGKSPRYALDADTATEIGVFKRVQPGSGQRVSQGGIGVFEVAARYSAVDLSSRDIRGGFQQDVTAGLNWYPEPFVRVMTNYIHAWADPMADGVTGRRADADIGQVRLQIAF
jgi:phosphate-selective porin OprO/OprP